MFNFYKNNLDSLGMSVSHCMVQSDLWKTHFPQKCQWGIETFLQNWLSRTFVISIDINICILFIFFFKARHRQWSQLHNHFSEKSCTAGVRVKQMPGEKKKNYSRKHVSEFAPPRLSRTEGQQSVADPMPSPPPPPPPTPQPGWDTEPLVWCWKRSWSRRFRRGCYPPGRTEFPWPEDLAAQTLISDQEPSAEAARAHTQPSPPTHSDALDLFMESPVGDQAISRLLRRFWSPFEETRDPFQPDRHRDDDLFSVWMSYIYIFLFRITLCENRWGAPVLFHPSHTGGSILVWAFRVGAHPRFFESKMRE